MGMYPRRRVDVGQHRRELRAPLRVLHVGADVHHGPDPGLRCLPHGFLRRDLQPQKVRVRVYEHKGRLSPTGYAGHYRGAVHPALVLYTVALENPVGSQEPTKRS